MNEFIDWLHARVGNMIVRAVVAADDDAPKMQLLKVLGRRGEIKAGLEHLQPYGFAFRVLPPDADGRGAETVALALEPDLRMCLPAADRRHRPAGLLPGEVMLHDDQGQRVHLTRAGLVLSTPVGKSITFKCGRSSIVIADTGITITAPAIDQVKAV